MYIIITSIYCQQTCKYNVSWQRKSTIAQGFLCEFIWQQHKFLGLNLFKWSWHFSIFELKVSLSQLNVSFKWRQTVHTKSYLSLLKVRNNFLVTSKWEIFLNFTPLPLKWFFRFILPRDFLVRLYPRPMISLSAKPIGRKKEIFFFNKKNRILIIQTILFMQIAYKKTSAALY
jgi:hypothetical protein